MLIAAVGLGTACGRLAARGDQSDEVADGGDLTDIAAAAFTRSRRMPVRVCLLAR
jgi:hypothetical protein